MHRPRILLAHQHNDQQGPRLAPQLTTRHTTQLVGPVPTLLVHPQSDPQGCRLALRQNIRRGHQHASLQKTRRTSPAFAPHVTLRAPPQNTRLRPLLAPRHNTQRGSPQVGPLGCLAAHPPDTRRPIRPSRRPPIRLAPPPPGRLARRLVHPHRLGSQLAIRGTLSGANHAITRWIPLGATPTCMVRLRPLHWPSRRVQKIADKDLQVVFCPRIA